MFIKVYDNNYLLQSYSNISRQSPKIANFENLRIIAAALNPPFWILTSSCLKFVIGGSEIPRMPNLKELHPERPNVWRKGLWTEAPKLARAARRVVFPRGDFLLAVEIIFPRAVIRVRDSALSWNITR